MSTPGMNKTISTIVRPLFSAEFPTTKRCGYPKMENKIHELRERYGLVTSWTAMPMDKQLELFHELCAYYDSLVFYDKLSCYEYHAHRKAYRTGFYAMQRMKARAKAKPDMSPFALIRDRCLPVCAPPLPENNNLEAQLDAIFSDKMYQMAKMELLIDAYEFKIGRTKFARALFPIKPLTSKDHLRIEMASRVAEKENILEDEYEHETALEDSQMELLQVTSQRSMTVREPEDHHVTLQRPPRCLATKAANFFAPSEVVVEPLPKAKFVESKELSEKDKSKPQQQPSYMDRELETKNDRRRVTALIPQGFHILAQRYKYETWDTEGIFYPRMAYTVLSFFMNRTQPPSPLAPGAAAPNGIVHIPWKLHHDALNGDKNSIHSIILQTSLR